MSLHIIQYAKAHPYTVGAIVLGGGIAFILFSGVLSGGASSSGVTSAPTESDAQVAADAQIQAATIAAQATAGQNQATEQIAQLQIQQQTNSDNLNAQLGLAALNVQQNLGLAQDYYSSYTAVEQTALANPVTNTKKSGGLLGLIGLGSSKTTTTPQTVALPTAPTLTTVGTISANTGSGPSL